MSYFRLAVAGALAVLVAVLVWLLIPGEPVGAPVIAGQEKSGVTAEAPPVANAPGTTDLEREAPPTGRVGKVVPGVERPSPFVRRQELERNGYDAAGSGVAAALGHLAAITTAADRAAFLRGMFYRFAEGGSFDAVQALKQLTNEVERRIGLKALVEARQPETPAGNRLAGGKVMSERAMAEFEEVMLMQHARGGVRGEFGAMILSLADQPELAVGLARELAKGPELGSLLAQIAAREVARDPARALSFGENLQGKERTDFQIRVASAWGEVDGAAAWAWAQGQSNDLIREGVLRGMAESDAPAAAQYLAQLGEGEARQRSLDVIGQVWGAKDTKAALDWANALPKAQEREGALDSIRKAAPVGIGAVLATEEGYPMIREVVPGGAASEFPQLAKGSRIASVRDADGNVVELHGKNLEDAVSLLRGAAGTAVTMEIIPPGGAPTDRQVVVLTRRQVLHKR